MTISDIITLISLIIAIVAILSEKNRKHLLLKFHIVDYLLFMTSFIFINYFVFYENFYLRGLYLHCLYFPKFGLKNPKYYAYIITLISLVYLCYKILYAFYPYSKIEKVRKFYRQLIENNEIPFLLDLIDRYHKSDIIKFIDRTSDNIPNDNYRANFYHKETFIEKLKKNCENVIQYLLPYSWFNRKIYGVYVLYNVLNDPAFISTASDKRPYFFADIFSHFKKEKRDGFPEELINSYLKELIENKNFWLKKELQESQKNDSGQPEYFYNENKIISALLQDLSVAEVNKIWQPFGNIAINEIEQERIIGYESKMFKDFIEEQSLWEYKTYFSIQFFKILIIETLVKKTLIHHYFAPSYYLGITKSILKTFEKFPPINCEKNKIIYYKFIDAIIDNCFLWLEISNKNNDEQLYHNIIDCFGDLLLLVCNNEYYDTDKKINYVESLFNLYCDLENNTQSENLRKKIGKIIVKPSTLAKDEDIYYNIVANVWNDFDKIPHRKPALNNDWDYFKQFKQDVIIPLKLKPDKS